MILQDDEDDSNIDLEYGDEFDYAIWRIWWGKKIILVHIYIYIYCINILCLTNLMYLVSFVNYYYISYNYIIIKCFCVSYNFDTIQLKKKKKIETRFTIQFILITIIILEGIV